MGPTRTAALSLSAVLWLVGCGRSAAPSPVGSITVAELQAKRSQLEDRPIIVTGELGERLGGDGFVLESGGGEGDEIILIIPDDTPTNLRAGTLAEGDTVIVSGVLERGPARILEGPAGWDLDLVGRTNEAHYLVARDVTRVRPE